MYFNFKEKKNSGKEFIIFPRYCGDCMKAFYLQYIPNKNPDSSAGKCPICNQQLWFFKSYAISNKGKDFSFFD